MQQRNKIHLASQSNFTQEEENLILTE
ncbi:hypothetical protein A2U01_0093149, partial [Trifolium medium]|nr:hypothetical protein [Trifolium medium]